MAKHENARQGFGFALEYDELPVAMAQHSALVRPLDKTAAGIAIAAVLIVTALLVPQISSVFASDESGSGSFFMQERQARRAPARQASVELSAPVFNVPSVAPMRLKSATYHSRASSPSSPVAGLGSRSVCVRLCDGFFFPVGDIGTSGDVAAQETTCENMCPGAPAKLFLMPANSDKIEDAVSARDAKRYTALPVAFRYNEKTERTCSCHAETRSSSVALLRDFTLRKGDGVMTPKGVKVFRGAQHWPYKRNDFLSLAEAQDLSGQDRGALAAIEQAAKGLRPVVPKAKIATPVPMPAKTQASPMRMRRDANGKHIRDVGPQAMLTQ